MRKYKIGQVLGKNNALLLLDKIDEYYLVECQICKQDEELYGKAQYKVLVDYFVKDKLPCGCSKNPKRTKSQWIIIIQRKAKENNHTFKDFVDHEKLNQNTKLSLLCNNCNHEWSTCSISNYIRNRNCPNCALFSKAEKKSTPDQEYISRFRKSGMFPEDKFSFTRLSKTGRMWKVYCSECDSDDFVSDRSNLIAGKLPCNCGTGGGFDVDKRSYFYILEIQIQSEILIKFGITNFPKRRFVAHNRVLKEVGGCISKIKLFTAEGSKVLETESELKRTLDIVNNGIEGFRTECCKISDLEKVIQALSSFQEIDPQTITI